ncbi:MULTISPECIES: NAD(P)/FAD-dependent oxidoreductase [Pseudonocardia]|uniref:NADH dehydrogenase-like protein n=2 Tax=Pseudonocardia TaxID=1847 RepID=A0A1Y2MW60_PSEAH|nr:MULTISPECIES: FAD-dependent oxidoreductase [Pseudonocardia]OSY38868.1 NADH dehydrogenase-like protein [Pseudonocardia autotrophica]TDN76124.1 NADH dehydrogenase FAD-containing subunit [Pseudonocardia autotrophica]BBG00105.1 pyridine nucleotide-disulfide oxidoreductase [Pseudonocardia autotrophica]GEC26070.1 pyridine nucleotide-disulfide oxidoreductase [Pseudonocardia saturnea]
MSNILVIGGGFAGVWAAAGAIRARHEAGADTDAVTVSLIGAADDLTIRPRLYEDDPQGKRVALDRILGPIGVRRIPAIVTDIDTTTRTVSALGRDGSALELSYDRLVLASGSRVLTPPVDGAEHLFDVDTLPAAAALEAHVGRLGATAGGDERFTAVVIGAGFTGLEIVTELPGRLHAVAGDRPVRVVLVERADAVGPELGPGPRPEILAALEHAGVELLLDVSLRSVDRERATLSDGTVIPTRTVIWTAGMRASALTELIPGKRDAIGRLEVDEHLRVVGVDGVYAAGDTAAAVAENGHVVTQSCQHAVPQGKLAGANVGADVLGLPLSPFAPNPYVTCLSLGPYGAVLTTGWDRTVALTGAEATTLKHTINSEWIYPPVDDAQAILALADHRTTWPTEAVPSPAA